MSVITPLRRLNALFALFGYKVCQVGSLRPVDVRQSHNNPRQLPYCEGRPLLVNAPITLGRIRHLPLSGPNNPFAYAVSVARDRPDSYVTIHSILRTYYALVQPGSALDWLGLDEDDARPLRGVPAWAAPEPWKAATVDQKRTSLQQVAMQESRKAGRALDMSHGDKAFGPVTDHKLSVEATRLHNVFLSIQQNGWRRHGGFDGDIEAVVFIPNESSWVWQVTRGLHRAAVLSGLGWPTATIRVRSLVRRCDADIWPNVLSGTYTKRGAETMFDRVFAGESPAVMQPWLRMVKDYVG